MRNKTSVFISIIVLLGGVYVLDGIDLPAQSRLWREFTNAGHAPLFGVLSIAVLVLSRTWITRFRLPLHHYYFAALTTSALGFLTEGIQYFTPRDASALDMTYNLVGIVSFLLCTATFDNNLRTLAAFRRLSLRNVARVMALLLFSIAFISYGTTTLAHAHRRVQFPTILDFESFLDKSFLLTSFAKIEFTSPPPEWSTNLSSRVAKWTISPDHLSAVTVQYPNPIWVGYEYFQMEIFSTLSQPMQITIRVNDVQHDFEFADRYNATREVSPGLNVITIPLADIENAPKDRKMDMSSIASIILFTTVRAGGQVLYVDNIKLE